MNSTAIYRRVSAGEISAEEGARLIMEDRRREKDWHPRQPRWMPRDVYLVGLIMFSILLAPILRPRD